MSAAPRISPPPLPTDPEARAYVEWERLHADFTRAIQHLKHADFVFLVGGKPFERVLPEDASALDIAVARNESWASVNGYIEAHSLATTDTLSLDDVYELCLTHMVDSNPHVKWRSVLKFLLSARLPFPESGFELAWDISDGERLLHELRLDADLSALTGEKVNNSIGFRHHMQSEGVDVEALIAAEDPGSLEAIIPIIENLEGLRARADYYRVTAKAIADGILLFDPEADLDSEPEYHRCISAHDYYAKAVNALTPSAAPQPLLSPENTVEATVEPLGAALSPKLEDLSTSPHETALRLSEALQTAPEALMAAVEERKEYLSPADVAVMLNMPVSTVTRHLRTGRLPGSKPGGHWIVNRESLEEFMRKERPISTPSNKVSQRPPMVPVKPRNSRGVVAIGYRPDGTPIGF